MGRCLNIYKAFFLFHFQFELILRKNIDSSSFVISKSEYGRCSLHLMRWRQLWPVVCLKKTARKDGRIKSVIINAMWSCQILSNGLSTRTHNKICSSCIDWSLPLSSFKNMCRAMHTFTCTQRALNAESILMLLDAT